MDVWCETDFLHNECSKINGNEPPLKKSEGGFLLALNWSAAKAWLYVIKQVSLLCR